MSVCLTLTLVTWTPDPDTDYCAQAQQAQPVVTRPSCDDQAMGLLSSDEEEEEEEEEVSTTTRAQVRKSTAGKAKAKVMNSGRRRGRHAGHR